MTLYLSIIRKEEKIYRKEFIITKTGVLIIRCTFRIK